MVRVERVTTDQAGQETRQLIVDTGRMQSEVVRTRQKELLWIILLRNRGVVRQANLHVDLARSLPRPELSNERLNPFWDVMINPETGIGERETASNERLVVDLRLPRQPIKLENITVDGEMAAK